MKPTPPSTVCTTCNNDGLVLAEDRTHYYEVTCDDGDWASSPLRHTEQIMGDETVRLFCPHCGERFHVPKTLP